MTTTYQPIDENDYWFFKTDMPTGMEVKAVTPGKKNVFIRRHPDSEYSEGSPPKREALIGIFGLDPWVTNEGSETKYFPNARTDKVAGSKIFGEIWELGQHCIIPMRSFPKSREVRLCKWREKLRITSENDDPFGVAGLWSAWQHRTLGHMIYRYVMLTISGESSLVIRSCRDGENETRMPLILPRSKYDAWLDVPPEKSLNFIDKCPTFPLCAHPASRKSKNQYL